MPLSVHPGGAGAILVALSLLEGDATPDVSYSP